MKLNPSLATDLKSVDNLKYETGKQIAEQLQKTPKYENEMIKKYKFSRNWWDGFVKNYDLKSSVQSGHDSLMPTSVNPKM